MLFRSVWEALAILVALRCWMPLFSHDTAVSVRSDSHGSLSAMSKLSSSSPGLNLIIAEIALDASSLPDGVTPVDQLVHIPGVSNIISDSLSRLYAPGDYQIPTILHDAVAATPSARSKSFWRTRTPPGSDVLDRGGAPRGP